MKQSGNALFLILIAVALFAALSYAITQSGRGGGNIDREQSVIELSQYNQRISLIRNGVQKMQLLNGLPINSIKFCIGAATDCDNTSHCTTGTDCVFAPEGGDVDPSFMSGMAAGTFLLHEPGGAVTLSGSPTNTLFVRQELTDQGADFTLSQCQIFNTSYGLSSTIEKEQTAGGLLIDGLTSLEGEWEFCYDAASMLANTVYMLHWVIAKTN